MNFVKNLLGGIAIMLVATLIGVAHNAARSKPMVLFPKLPKTAENKIPPASGNDAVGDTVAGESATPIDMSAPTVTEAEIAAGELVMERVKTILEAGSTIIIDARGEGEYAEGHVPGAINIPYDKFIEYFDDIERYVPMDSPVIVYCTSVTCDLGDKLATELRLMGHEKVVVYRGGWDEWSEAEYPGVTGSDPE